jgi:hypothetical protein
VALGSATFHTARERAIASNQAAADERAAKVLPIIRKQLALVRGLRRDDASNSGH